MLWSGFTGERPSRDDQQPVQGRANPSAWSQEVSLNLDELRV